MKKLILVLFAAVIAVSANAQEKKNLFKSIYEDIFKYSPICSRSSISMSV